jgi:ribosomal protein L37AE/L43A
VSTPDSAVTASSDIDPCPHCGTTAGVRLITSNPPKVQAWSCVACGTQWAVSVVNPHLYLNRLTAAVELAAARSVLREIIALADGEQTLTDAELRARLVQLAGLMR